MIEGDKSGVWKLQLYADADHETNCIYWNSVRGSCWLFWELLINAHRVFVLKEWTGELHVLQGVVSPLWHSETIMVQNFLWAPISSDKRQCMKWSLVSRCGKWYIGVPMILYIRRWARNEQRSNGIVLASWVISRGMHRNSIFLESVFQCTWHPGQLCNSETIVVQDIIYC